MVGLVAGVDAIDFDSGVWAETKERASDVASADG